jgi:UDP-N-acetylmuramoylalanine--D-glutamate ligase
MNEGRTYTIHKSKKSQTDRALDARESLRRTLESTAHRLELVRTLREVEYFNDARSVDLLSTRDSFKCMLKPIVWIAAATPHDRDYALLEKYVTYKIKSIVVCGTGGDDMRRKLEHMVEKFLSVRDLSTAIALASREASAGEAVLYSPSCIPTDEFRNFVDRGTTFARIVNELK